MSIHGFNVNGTIYKYDYSDLDNISVVRSEVSDAAFCDFADVFSSSKTYSIGDYAFYNQALYRCVASIETPENWTPGHWTAVVLGDDIIALKGEVDALNEGGLDLKDDVIGEKVDEWLDDHPESTTTVADGSLTEAKLSNSLKEKTINDFVTPELFGAVGDGTTNDASAIQNAINSGVEKIVFGNKTYRIDGRISLRSNLVLDGKNTILVWSQNDSNDSSLIGGQYLSNIAIKGITFDFGTQSVLRISFSLIDSANITVKDCTFTGGYGYSWRINGDHGILFENCHFHNITGATGNPGGAIFGMDYHDVSTINCSCDTLDDHFLYVAGATECYNILVSGCTFVKTGSSGLTGGSAVCIYANSHDIIVTDNIFKECRNGVYIGRYGDYSGLPHKVTVSNNIIRTIDQNGITVEGIDASSRSYDICINGNIIDHTTQDAISLKYAARCSINNCNIDHPSRFGITLDVVEYSTITSCIISNALDTAFLVGRGTSPCSYCKFDNITLTGADASASQGLYSRQAEYCQYTNISSTGFISNIIRGGAYCTFINTQEVSETKSIYFTNDITKSAYHNIGDVVIASNPTSGEPAIWICTAAGNPGTMTAIARVPS